MGRCPRERPRARRGGAASGRGWSEANRRERANAGQRRAGGVEVNGARCARARARGGESPRRVRRRVGRRTFDDGLLSSRLHHQYQTSLAFHREMPDAAPPSPSSALLERLGGRGGFALTRRERREVEREARLAHGVDQGLELPVEPLPLRPSRFREVHRRHVRDRPAAMARPTTAAAASYRSGSEASRASPSPACSPRRGSAAMRRGGGGTGAGSRTSASGCDRASRNRSLGSRAGGAGARAGKETARGGVRHACPSVLRTTCAYTARLLKNTFRWCNRSPTAMARVAIARAREEVGGASGTRARAARRGIAAGHRVGHARRDCRAAGSRRLSFRFSLLSPEF